MVGADTGEGGEMLEKSGSAFKFPNSVDGGGGACGLFALLFEEEEEEAERRRFMYFHAKYPLRHTNNNIQVLMTIMDTGIFF